MGHLRAKIVNSAQILGGGCFAVIIILNGSRIRSWGLFSKKTEINDILNGSRIRSWGLFSKKTEINDFRLQVLRTRGLQALTNAIASINSNLDRAFPFNTNPGKPLISVFLLNKPHHEDRRDDIPKLSSYVSQIEVNNG